MPLRQEIGWDRIYHRYRLESLPWELGKPRKTLVELVESGQVKPNKILDLCYGAETNPVYLVSKGFEVNALDISDKAVEYAKGKAKKAAADVNFLVADFVWLPFRSEKFDFAFDFGCFHHVDITARTIFIKGVYRVLKQKGSYFLVCFSDKNGPAWNHFSKNRLLNYSEIISRSNR